MTRICYTNQISNLRSIFDVSKNIVFTCSIQTLTIRFRKAFKHVKNNRCKLFIRNLYSTQYALWKIILLSAVVNTATADE